MQPQSEDDGHNWTEPGIYATAPGVYRIPLQLPNDGLRAVNVYAVTDGDRLVLIDSGWALDAARADLAAALGGIGAELGDVREFLVTHVHRDHYTQAITLRREFGGSVALGELEAPSLRAAADPDFPPMDRQMDLLERAGAEPVLTALRALISGHQSREKKLVWEDPDEWLSPGRRTVLPGRELDVVHTPGHTTGHVIFDDGAAGLMFTGDHVLPHITPSIGFEAIPPELPLNDYLGSLRLVRGMPDRRMLPAHGPVCESVHSRVDALLEHHRDRLALIGETIAAGAGTAYESAQRIGWTRRQRKLDDLDPLNQMLAVLETGAHLDLLLSQGKLLAEQSGKVRVYRLP